MKNKPTQLCAVPFSDKGPIPYSTDMEVSVLGYIFLRNGIMGYLDFLEPYDFYTPIHQDIFSAMRKLRDEGAEITPFTVMRYLPDIKKFEPAQPQSYMAALIAQGGNVLGMPVTQAKQILDMSRRRRIINACDNLRHAIGADNDPMTITQHVNDMRDFLETISESGDETLLGNIGVMEKVIRSVHEQVNVYSTGFAKLDNAMQGGFFAGKSYGIAARKKCGKTAMAATISGNLNLAGVKHLFICGEMSAAEIQQRILCRYAQIYPSAFRSDYGKSDDCANKINKAIQKMPGNTFFNNAAGMTFASLKNLCRMAVERKKVKGIIIDYWQLVGGKQKGQSTSEHLDEVAQWIADFSRQHEIFTLTMAQLNQDGNTRGSEGIRLAFDMLFELHREDVTAPGAWLEMIETRYTPWMSIGCKTSGGYLLEDKGPYFEEMSVG